MSIERIMRIASGTNSLRTGWIVMTLVALGCSNPPAVKRFASASTAAGKAFPEIADDLPGSCIRRERYHFLADWRSDLDSLDTLTRAACERYTRAAPRLAGAHRVLVSYLDALGKLSAGDLVEYDKGVDALGGALAAVNPADKKTIEAASSISGTLAEAAALKWRRKELAGMIARSNADVQTLASALRGVIEVDYARLLDDEWEAARKFYLGMLDEHRESEPLTAMLVYERWRGDQNAIIEKRKTARAYVKLLDKIAAGHQDLYDHRDALSSKEARALILKHAEAIEDLAAGKQTVF